MRALIHPAHTLLLTSLSLTAGLTAGLMASRGVEARPARVGHVPSGAQLGCFTCHLSAQGGATNAFGYDASLTLVGGTVQWDQLCALDSDLDGFTNGEELGDSACVWRINDGPNPDGLLTPTNPGDPNSYPMEAPDVGPLPDMSPPLDLGPMMDMAVELDMAPALPDADLWDAWLERPDAPDAFTLTPLDLSPPDDRADMERLEGGEVSEEGDVGVNEDLSVRAGTEAGTEVGTDAGGALSEAGSELGSELKSSQETSLQDPYAGCQSAPPSSRSRHSHVWALWALLLSLGALVRRARHRSL